MEESKARKIDTDIFRPLKRLSKIKNETIMSTRICLYSDLANKTLDYEKKVNGNKTGHWRKSVEEFGLVRIRQLLSSFNQLDSPTRCDCCVRCRRNILTITELPSIDNKGYEFGSAHFQVNTYLAKEILNRWSQR